jgi:hypothetical protein
VAESFLAPVECLRHTRTSDLFCTFEMTHDVYWISEEITEQEMAKKSIHLDTLIIGCISVACLSIR